MTSNLQENLQSEARAMVSYTISKNSSAILSMKYLYCFESKQSKLLIRMTFD